VEKVKGGKCMPQQLNTVFTTFTVIMGVGTFAIYIIAVLALWKAMKAHESLANSVRIIAENFKPDKDPNDI
jgi:uncharacterized membrane protein (DUF485 family)